MISARLIVDPPAPGSWNMAVDDALLGSAATRSQPSLRIYAWSEPTVSLGYFQPHARRALHSASAQCPLVRRATGGGAIVHDRELTYSLTLPLTGELRFPSQHWYRAVHGTLIATLARLGIQASICPRTVVTRNDRFLCFQRRTRGDVLVADAKVAGSAQRRTATALLQHGSILLSRSPAAPELPGLEQLSGDRLPPAALLECWLPQLANRLRLRWQRAALTPQELAHSHRMEQQRFNEDIWTLKR